MKKIILFIVMIVILIGSSSYAFATKRDIVAPSITNTYPKNNETDIMIESTIMIRFDEKILKGKTIAKIGFVDADSKKVSFTYEIEDNLLRIIPKEKLKYDTEYKLTIPTGLVKDSTGLAMAKQRVLSFKTEKSLYSDQSDEEIMINEEENNSAVVNPVENTNTANMLIHLEAYVADENMSVVNETIIARELQKIGIYVKGISNEITHVQTYDIILEDGGSYSGQVMRVLWDYFHYDDFTMTELVLYPPSVVARNLDWGYANIIKYNIQMYGGTVSIVESGTYEEEEETDEEN